MKDWQHKSFTIREFDEISSTNDKAFELFAAHQIFDRFVVMAHWQTKGRGRENRDWTSPQGNLYFSLLLCVDVKISIIPQLSFVAAIALRDTIEKVLSFSDSANVETKVSLKWPNDVLINEKKVAGILLETKSIAENRFLTVVGIGVNIASSPSNTIFPAGNLKDFNSEISPQELLKSFLQQFEISYKNWQDFGFVGVRNSWLRSAYNFGKKITLRSLQLTEGIFKDLDPEGNLLLEQNGKLVKISAGEILLK